MPVKPRKLLMAAMDLFPAHIEGVSNPYRDGVVHSGAWKMKSFGN